MNGLNFQASVANVTQMDRHHHDSHRAPGENQEQNALLAREEASRRMVMTVQAQAADGKKVDPGQRRSEKPPNKKNRKKDAGAGSHRRLGSDGMQVDVEA
jgi:hypothetical protein